MTPIKSLPAQLAEITAKIIGAAAAKRRVVAIELPSDLYEYMKSTLPEGMEIPDGIFESPKLLPGRAQFHFENDFESVN
jgi:hypothetical protein